MKKQLPIIRTERLVLRPFRMTDAADLYEFASDPEVGRNAGWKPHESPEESMEAAASFIRGEDPVFALALPGENGKVIGSVGLSGDDSRGLKTSRALMLGYVLSRQYWGHGYMTEGVRAVLRYAFSLPGVSMVTVRHYPHNSRSRRVIEKLGFTCEGTLRCASELYDGTVYDTCVYSLLKTEFAKQCSEFNK